MPIFKIVSISKSENTSISFFNNYFQISGKLQKTCYHHLMMKIYFFKQNTGHAIKMHKSLYGIDIGSDRCGYSRWWAHSSVVILVVMAWMRLALQFLHKIWSSRG